MILKVINFWSAVFWWTNYSDWIHMQFMLRQKVYSAKLLNFFSSMPKFIDYLVRFYDFSHCAWRNAKGKKSGGLGRAKILVCQQEDWHLTLLWPLLCVGCSKSFARQSCRATGSYGDVGTTQVPINFWQIIYFHQQQGCRFQALSSLMNDRNHGKLNSVCNYNNKYQIGSHKSTPKLENWLCILH